GGYRVLLMLRFRFCSAVSDLRFVFGCSNALVRTYPVFLALIDSYLACSGPRSRSGGRDGPAAAFPNCANPSRGSGFLLLPRGGALADRGPPAGVRPGTAAGASGATCGGRQLRDQRLDTQWLL